MATLRDLSPEEQEQDEQRRMQGLGSLAGPSRNLAAGRPSSGPMGGGGIGPAGGGGFVGLDRYRAANESATTELGNKVVGSVEQSGADARTALGKASADFNAGVGAGEVRADSGLLSRLSSDPTRITGSTADLGRFTRMRDASYTGPRQLDEVESYGGAQEAIGKAAETRELSGTDQGVSQLSDRSVTGERTTGGRSFDTALLLGDPTLRGRLNTARDGLGTLEGERDAASQSAITRAGEAQQTTDATREQTRGALTSASTAFEQQLEQRLKLNRDEATARANAAQQQLALGQNNTSLPTAGAAGRYYDSNDPTQGQYADRAAVGAAADPGLERALLAYWATPEGRAALDARLQTPEGLAQFAQGMNARNVPEFIHNTGGQQMLAGFNAFLPTRAGPAPGAQALADLGIAPQQWAALSNLAPVGELANAAAMGTSNVNPYAYVEDYESRVGDLGRFITRQDPNATINRENSASAGDYSRAAALEQLAGPELARRVLDPAQAGRAGTANLDLIDFDLGGAANARASALESLYNRTGAHVAGNARSGGNTFLKDFGVPLLTGGLAPQGSSFKDLASGLVPGSDFQRHILDPRTPVMLPGGAGGTGLPTPGRDFAPDGYNDFTKQMAADRMPLSEDEALERLRAGGL